MTMFRQTECTAVPRLPERRLRLIRPTGYWLASSTYRVSQQLNSSPLALAEFILHVLLVHLYSRLPVRIDLHEASLDNRGQHQHLK